MKIKLNKEQIEAKISEYYVGSNNYQWTDVGLEFDAFKENEDKKDVINSNRNIEALVIKINELNDEIAFLNGRINESEKLFKDLLNQSFEG